MAHTAHTKSTRTKTHGGSSSSKSSGKNKTFASQLDTVQTSTMMQAWTDEYDPANLTYTEYMVSGSLEQPPPHKSSSSRSSTGGGASGSSRKSGAKRTTGA